MSKNEKQGKNGRKTQLERVMHQRARGHEVEPKNSHFLCPKTKRNKTRERGATGESHAPTCKRSRGRACNSHFFMSKNEKEKRGRKAQLGRVMHVRTRGHEAERSHSHFYAHNREKLQSENHGLYTQYYEEICTHIFFLVPYKCKR